MKLYAQVSTRDLERRHAKLQKLGSPELGAVAQELQARHKAKGFKPITESELRKWSTKRLLRYIASLRVPAYFADWDSMGTEDWQKPYIAEHDKVRAILASREHIPGN